MTPALRCVALVLAGAAFACVQDTQFVQVRESSNQPLALSRVAVVPFSSADRPGATLRPDAPELVAGYLTEALAARGIDVIPPSDVAQGLGGSGDPRAVAQTAHDRFGADAVALGRVYRFRERSGQALGSVNPASVGFEVRILAAPEGRVLWSGAFDETQVALGENLLRAPRYPGGGTRWLTAEEFARWGAREVANKLPLAP